MFIQNTPVTGQTNFKRYMPPAIPGMKSGFGDCVVMPHVNNVGLVDIFEIDPPAAVDANSTYYISISSVKIQFETGASTSGSDLMLGLYQSAIVDPIFYSFVDIAYDASTDKITVSARTIGTTLSVSTNTDLTNPVTVAKTQSTSKNSIIPFGRFVGRKRTYEFDQLEGVSSATLIDNDIDYTVLGITLSSHATEKVGRFEDAQDGYDFGYVMNVLKNTGAIKGVWIECTDTDIIYGDDAYIDVSAGNEGKITKNAIGTVDARGFVNIVSATQTAFSKIMVLAEVKL